MEHWRAHLAATEKPVTVLTDHANLTFWKNPCKVNRRVAHWFATLQDYNLRIKHVPGKLHAAADMLSRPPDADKGDEDNQNLTLLPLDIFIQLMTKPPEDWVELERTIGRRQKDFSQLIEKWKHKHALRLTPSTTAPMTPASLMGKHSYVFCQFVSPALAHENGPCTCFDVKWR